MDGKTCTRLASDLFRQRTSEMKPVTLRRKTCPVPGCGKVLTAKQLVQYGKCMPCVRIAAAAANDSEKAA